VDTKETLVKGPELPALLVTQSYVGSSNGLNAKLPSVRRGGADEITNLLAYEAMVYATRS
jgi:hypothetical protein